MKTCSRRRGLFVSGLSAWFPRTRPVPTCPALRLTLKPRGELRFEHHDASRRNGRHEPEDPEDAAGQVSPAAPEHALTRDLEKTEPSKDR